MARHTPLIINGWTIYAHPLFLDQVESLITQVQKFKHKYPDSYKDKNASKRLAAILKLAFDVIPQDPAKLEYRQGSTLGNQRKHWFRAVFFQQYRLFFRFHTQSRVIVLAWVNDSKTRRAYESRFDAYRVFKKSVRCNIHARA